MTQLFLHSEHSTCSPQTESIKYLGSKLKLLPQILQLIQKTGASSVLDGFAGSTHVSQALAKSGYRVVSNDVAIWSEVLGTCYLLSDRSRMEYRDLIRHLNNAEPKEGWFTAHYGGQANGGCSVQKDGYKRPWQIHNTRKLDGIREEIEKLSLSKIEKSVALTSLLLALDRVDSTIGHFASYLKEWAPRSYNQLHLRVPDITRFTNEHEVRRKDVFSLAKCEVDLAYYDPPYGSNNEKMPPSRVRYASYYHLWTTICLNDFPQTFGRARRRTDSSDTIAGSVFEEFRRSPTTGRFIAVEAIERLIQSTKARWILLSYSSGGRATAEELGQILSSNGKLVEVVKVDYQKNVMAGMKWTNEWVGDADRANQEFLFLIDKGGG